MAALLLGRLLTRPDMPNALSEFLTWSVGAVQEAADQPYELFLVPGALGRTGGARWPMPFGIFSSLCAPCTTWTISLYLPRTCTCLAPILCTHHGPWLFPCALHCGCSRHGSCLAWYTDP